MSHGAGLLYANPADSAEKHISPSSMSSMEIVLLKLFWNNNKKKKEYKKKMVHAYALCLNNPALLGS